MQDEVPHPYKRTAKIKVLSVLIFHFTCMEDKKDSGFCDVLLNGLVQNYWHFRGTCCLHRVNEKGILT